MKENVDEVWSHDIWTNQARQIIDAIAEFPKDSKLILILRHSHRNNSRDINETINMNLTPLGKKIAIKFGEFLPHNRTIRLCYSLSPRCEETAKYILLGFQNVNGHGKLEGPLKPLYNVGGTGVFITAQAFKYSGQGFVMRWVSGLYPPKFLMRFDKYCQSAANIIWKQILTSPSDGIDIHITHDLFLMALRMGWFGIPPNDVWPSFLGGLLFSVQKNRIILLNSGKLEFFEIPYWYKL